MFLLRSNLRRLGRLTSTSISRHGQFAGLSSATFARRFAVEVRAAERLLLRSVAIPASCASTQRSYLSGRAFSSSQQSSQSRKEAGSGGSGAESRGNESGKESGDGDNDDEKERMRKLFKLMVFTNVAFFAMYMLFRNSSAGAAMQQAGGQNGGGGGGIHLVSWNEFYHDMLAKGEVEEVSVFPQRELALIRLHPGAVIKGQPSGQRMFMMNVLNVDEFESRLREAERQLGVNSGSVPVTYHRSNINIVGLLLTLLLIGLLVRAFKQGPKSGLDMFSSLRNPKVVIVDQSTVSQRPKVRFSDVAGCHTAKQELGEFVDYLQDSTKYKKLGAKPPKGVLLLGPPGCGKTLLAKAVSTESKVPFLAIAGSEFIEMVGGLGAARVRSLFQKARKLSPCIIYIDEIDAIGRNRSMDQSSGEGEQTLNQLLVEMDGMATKEGVLMLASTNRPDVLDKALLRPGRFDRHIQIDLPNLAERIEMFDYYLAELVLDKHPTAYSKRLAQLTPGFSGADIANVCNEAALHAARTQKRLVASQDIDYAIDRVFGGAEKQTHAVTPEERKRLAVYWSGFAIVAWFLERTEKLLKLSITARTKSIGTVQFDPSERLNYTTEELFGKICVKLAGRAAEVAIYGQPSSGTAMELKTVTNMAKAMVESYGMDDIVGPLSFQNRKAYSKRLANTLDYQASQLVQQAYNKALEVLRQNKDKLQELAEELEKKEVLHHSDIEAVLGPRPHDQPDKGA